jgi:hypothetical protein
MYGAVAIFGYFTFGSFVHSDILTNYPDNILTSMARFSVSIMVYKCLCVYICFHICILMYICILFLVYAYVYMYICIYDTLGDAYLPPSMHTINKKDQPYKYTCI